MFIRILVGIVGIIAGFFLIYKAEWFLENFGRIDWAEIHLGAEGGTRLFYKLIGLGVILVSILIMTGLIEGLLLAIFGPLFGRR
jgi:hypothetical protein